MSSRTKLASYEDAIREFEPTLGLEVHVELGTNSKMFCACATDFGAAPNTQVCPVCLALPGTLPVVNKAAIESTIRMGLALNCEIVPRCRFARKNYFYPDMPKNYQISQYDEPICINGHLDVEVATDDGVQTFRVEIERVHMEEDTGKLTHAGGATGRIHGADYSLVDYNRAGIPLVEIVTKTVPGTGSLAPEVARAYVSELREIMRTIGVSDVRMEEGSLRCDANVSLARPGEPLGTRTETKNVNSLRSVERAVRYEIRRHAAVLQDGGRIKQETRHFHEDDGSTTPGRSKEEAEDYRYFPEPDLMPVEAAAEWVDELRATLPEMPAARRKRLQSEWNISAFDMQSVINADAVGLVEQTVAAGVDSAKARKWWLGELSRLAKERGVDLGSLPVTPEHIVEVEALVSEGSLNDKLARQVFEGLVAGEGDVPAIVQGRGLALVSDDSALIEALEAAMAANADAVAKVRDGQMKASGAIIGAVMKATRGQADAARVRELLMERI